VWRRTWTPSKNVREHSQTSSDALVDILRENSSSSCVTNSRKPGKAPRLPGNVERSSSRCSSRCTSGMTGFSKHRVLLPSLLQDLGSTIKAMARDGLLRRVETGRSAPALWESPSRASQRHWPAYAIPLGRQPPLVVDKPHKMGL
jgi:hypothetical protein